MENKKLKIWLPITIIILIVVCTLYPLLNPQIKRKVTISALKNDEQNMRLIAQEWETHEYTYMFTDKDKYKIGIIDVDYKPNENIINDKKDKNIEYLLNKKNYQYIMKSDNAVYFTKYSSLGNGYGVAFSVDGKKPQNEFIISSEKIAGFDEWYFYIMR